MSNYRLCDTCGKRVGRRWRTSIAGADADVRLDGCTDNRPDAGRIVMHDGIEDPRDLCAGYDRCEES